MLQEQVWTAAHELGHVWKVDEYVRDNIANTHVDAEKIVGRLVAEFMMPSAIFYSRSAHNRLSNNKYKGGSLSTEMMMDLITYMMR